MNIPIATLGLPSRAALATSSVCGDDALSRTDACWRAAHDLSVGQACVYDNPLLREQLTLAHDKLAERKHHIDRHGEDLPEIRNWKGGDSPTNQTANWKAPIETAKASRQRTRAPASVRHSFHQAAKHRDDVG